MRPRDRPPELRKGRSRSTRADANCGCPKDLRTKPVAKSSWPGRQLRSARLIYRSYFRSSIVAGTYGQNVNPRKCNSSRGTIATGLVGNEMTGHEAVLAWRLFELTWIPLAAISGVFGLSLVLTDFSVAPLGIWMLCSVVMIYAGFTFTTPRPPHRGNPTVVFMLGSFAQTIPGHRDHDADHLYRRRQPHCRCRMRPSMPSTRRLGSIGAPI